MVRMDCTKARVSGAKISSLTKERSDLDGIERELGKVAQARISGAEVVHRQADSHPVQLLHDLCCAVDPRQRCGFGELDLQKARLEPGFAAEISFTSATKVFWANWTLDTLTAT